MDAYAAQALTATYTSYRGHVPMGATRDEGPMSLGTTFGVGNIGTRISNQTHSVVVLLLSDTVILAIVSKTPRPFHARPISKTSAGPGPCSIAMIQCAV